MSVRSLNFNEIAVPNGMLFDKLNLQICFKTTRLPVSTIKSYQFQYVQNNAVMKKTINAKIHIPPNYYKCHIYAHVSIINMKTMIQVVEIELEQNTKNIDEQNLVIETELGPVLITYNYEEQNYIGSQIDSEISSSTVSNYQLKDNESVEQSIVQKYQSDDRKKLMDSEQNGKSRDPKSFIKTKKNDGNFLSDGNFNDSTKKR